MDTRLESISKIEDQIFQCYRKIESLKLEKERMSTELYNICQHDWERIIEDGPYPAKYWTCKNCKNNMSH